MNDADQGPMPLMPRTGADVIERAVTQERFVNRRERHCRRLQVCRFLLLLNERRNGGEPSRSNQERRPGGTCTIPSGTIARGHMSRPGDPDPKSRVT